MHGDVASFCSTKKRVTDENDNVFDTDDIDWVEDVRVRLMVSYSSSSDTDTGDFDRDRF